MKKITLALLFTSVGYAQVEFNKVEYFTASVIADPYASAKEKGLLIGAEIEYVGLVYTRVGITHFSKLKDGYTDAIVGIGINLTSGYFGEVRYYAGGRIGVIKRQATNATAGAEAGIDFKVNETLFVGVRGTLDYRSDQEFYDGENGMIPSGFIRVGFKF